MKRTLLFLCLLAGITAAAQKPNNYLYSPSRERKIAQMADSGYTTVPLAFPYFPTGTSHQAGLMIVDTSGGGKGFHVVWDGVFHHLIDSVALHDTAAAIRASGGSGISTFGQAVDNGNSATKGIVLSKRDSVGTVFSYFMPTNPISGTTATDNTATAALTTDGTRMTITGTAARNLNNFVDFPTVKVGADNFTVTWKMVIKDSINAQGIAVAVIVGGTAASMMAHYIICPDSSSYINYTSTVTTPSTADLTNKDKANFRCFQGDTVQFFFQRRSRTGTFSMYDQQTGSVSELKLTNTIFAGVGNLRLYDYGGTWHFIDSFKIKYDEPYGPDIMALTDSWGYGGGARTEYAGHWYISTQGFSAVRSAGSGETSAQAVNRFGDIVLIHPRYCGWFLGINDLNGTGTGPGAALDSFCKRTIRFITLCQSIGTIPFLSTLGPQVTDAKKYNDSIYAIAGRYGNLLVMPRYETLRNSNPALPYMDDKFVTSDPVHPNDNGHRELGLMERKKYDSLFAKRVPLELQDLPKVSQFDGLLVIRDGNKVAIALPGSDPGYIIAQPSVSSAINPQDANMFITGTTWMTSNVRLTPPGTSITAAPYFSMDFTGITAQPFTSRNFTTVGGHSVFDGTIANSTDAIDLLNDIKFKPLNYPFKILAKGITTSKVAFSVNNESATVPFDDSIAAFHVNDSIKAYINRFGGGRFYWQSGYMRPMDYPSMNGLDFVDKTQLDSIAAALAAGTGSITGATDGGGFDFTSALGLLSLKTQIGNGRILFSDNSFDLKGSDSITFKLSQLKIKDFTLNRSNAQFGEINIQTALANNSFIGIGVDYETALGGFVRTHSGQNGMLLYGLNGDFSVQVNSSTGAVNSSWAPTAQITFKNTGRFGFNNITTPNSWTQLATGTTALAPLTFGAGTNLTTPLTGAVEYDGTNYFATNSTPTRQVVITGSTSTPLTSGTTPVATTGGKLTDGLILGSTTFTPTFTGSANYASSTLVSASYTRVGSWAYVTIYGTVTATAGGSSVIFAASLPIASNLTAQGDAIGSGVLQFAGSNETALVLGDATNDRVVISSSAIGSTNARDFCVTFRYEIK